MTSRPVIGPGDGAPVHAMFELTAQAVQTYSLDDTYQKITGNWSAGQLAYFHEGTGDKLVYDGPSGRHFLFSGSSDLSANKACVITYGLYLNGALVPAAQTPHTFVSPNKVDGIGITAIVTLTLGDEIEVFSKVDDASAVIAVETLRITLWGEHR